MKALVYMGPGQLEVEEREIPAPKKGEVQIKIKKVSICGSDLGAYRHASDRFMPPLVLGHRVFRRHHGSGRGRDIIGSRTESDGKPDGAVQ